MKVDLGIIDFGLLKEQKHYLMMLQKQTGRDGNKESRDLFEGVLGLFDKIQDEAVKTGLATVVEVFGVPETLEDITWDMVEQYYPNYSSADTILESDILQKYYDGELHPVDNKDDILWVMGLDDWRQYRDDLDKGIKAATMEAMEKSLDK